MGTVKIKIIDLFCGAGGLSTGAMMVDGVEVIACVNHDSTAIDSHKANHPKVLHFPEDVRDFKKVIKPLQALVNLSRSKDPDCKILLWASLECTNFSKAKGGLPREADSRTLAECMIKVENPEDSTQSLPGYIPMLKPDAIWIENVEEFMAWGPLDENGKPLNRKKGSDYMRWIQEVKAFGYKFDHRILNSADFGAFTSRRRYFGQFQQHQHDINWPEPTHSKTGSTDLFKGLKKWNSVRELIEFNNKGQSIFTRKIHLSDNTFRRIYAGLVKYVANGNTSFITQYNGGSYDQRVYDNDRPLTSVSTNNRHALVQPEFLLKYYGTATTSPIDTPLGAVNTKDRFSVVWLDKQYSGKDNHQSVDQPSASLTANPKLSLCTAFIMNPQFKSNGVNVDQPCFTLIARMDKKPPYLVQLSTGYFVISVTDDDTIHSIRVKLFCAAYGIRDMYMRMLTIPELKRIMGFPEKYILLGTQTQQKKFIGNAVEVNMAKALIAAEADGYNAYSQTQTKAG